ncbi:MAG: hypothetical protein IPJ88_12310 [Myxococcales bacterium]|nr:MAG: hypothetical protein IPJ88_12310 [Myxococcales bacterium]
MTQTSLFFEATDLEHIDTLEVDALCLTLFEDERPLRSVNAVIDWRLCTQISQLIKEGHFSGKAGEQCLLPTQKRFRFPSIFVLGLGLRADFNPNLADSSVKQLFAMMKQAQLRNFAMLIPGRSIEVLDETQAIESVLSNLSNDWDFDRLIIIDLPQSVATLKKHYDKRRREKRRLKELQHGMA